MNTRGGYKHFLVYTARVVNDIFYEKTDVLNIDEKS